MGRLGVVIFGATGFTGKLAALEMARVSKKHDITWGVAGRSRSKLESLMHDLANKTGEDQSHVKIIIADVSDAQSLQEMCLQATVIANCCGPYRLLGEPVVGACVIAGTHHIDISGEPQFIESMQLKYEDAARAAGVYVVSACGFDSIPNDVGTVFLQQQFGGTLNSVESYMRFTVPAQYRREAAARGTVHFGTWESLVYALENLHELKALRHKLFPERLPTLKPQLETRGLIHSRGGGWCVPFPGVDGSIVYRTQRTLYKQSGQRPAHFRAYISLGPCLLTVAMVLWAAAIYVLTRFSFFCRLMREYPRVFTAGVVSHKGPAPAVMEHTSYQVTLHGEGWAEGSDLNGTPDKRVVAKVSGLNPGYGATVSALMYSAVTILQERDKMPGNGGVLTTGYAFRNTNIIKHLSENNMKFEIIESTKIN